MKYKVYVTRQLPNGTYIQSKRIYNNLFTANQYYNDCAEDVNVVNIEMERIK